MGDKEDPSEATVTPAVIGNGCGDHSASCGSASERKSRVSPGGCCCYPEKELQRGDGLVGGVGVVPSSAIPSSQHARRGNCLDAWSLGWLLRWLFVWSPAGRGNAYLAKT